MRNYRDLLERERTRLIYVADAIVDKNPLWLLRLPGVGVNDVNPLFARLNAMFPPTTPVGYYEQVFDALRDNLMLHLLEDGETT